MKPTFLFVNNNSNSNAAEEDVERQQQQQQQSNNHGENENEYADDMDDDDYEEDLDDDCDSSCTFETEREPLHVGGDAGTVRDGNGTLAAPRVSPTYTAAFALGATTGKSPSPTPETQWLFWMELLKRRCLSRRHLLPIAHEKNRFTILLLLVLLIGTGLSIWLLYNKYHYHRTTLSTFASIPVSFPPTRRAPFRLRCNSNSNSNSTVDATFNTTNTTAANNCLYTAAILNPAASYYSNNNNKNLTTTIVFRFYSSSFSSLSSLPVLDLASPSLPDYGGLTIQRQQHNSNTAPPVHGQNDKEDATVAGAIAGAAQARVMDPNDTLHWHADRDATMTAYSHDVLEEEFWSYGDASSDPHSCRWAKAVYTPHPVCNSFHEWGSFWEQDQHHHQQPVVTFVGRGFYREAWLIHPYPSAAENKNSDGIRRHLQTFAGSNNNNNAGISHLRRLKDNETDNHARTTTAAAATTTEDVSLVVKRTQLARDFNRNRLQKLVTEAVILEQRSDSPALGNIYGYCAFSIAIQPGLYDMEASVLTSNPLDPEATGQVSAEEWAKASASGAHSFNAFSVSEKLDILLQMTESLAEVHGLPTGPVAVGDIAVDQWLRSAADPSRIILNDLDNAVFLSWNETSQKYCPYFSNYVGGFPSPEEHEYSIQDESVDIWKVGSIVFAVLTGLKPYYETTDMQQVWDLLDAREMPSWDHRFSTRSFVEGRFVELMEYCFQWQPADRIDIFQIVAFLRETKRMSDNGDRV